jgi:hypothetical protein
MPPRPSGHAWRARLIDLVRYAAVSAISTTVGLTSLALLVVVGHWPAGWANLVGTGLGTTPVTGHHVGTTPVMGQLDQARS